MNKRLRIVIGLLLASVFGLLVRQAEFYHSKARAVLCGTVLL